MARAFIPIAALAAARRLLPLGHARPGATEPNRLVLLVPVGAVVLAIGLVTLGVGLLAPA